MPSTNRTSTPKPKPRTEDPRGSKSASQASQVQGTHKDKAKGRNKAPCRPSGLRSSLLMLYGALALAITTFGILCESMRHHVPSQQFQRRDGQFIDISAFDPLELGPFPRCHEHFGEHLSANGSWVKNSEVNEPFPPGHPENPEWLEKLRKQQVDDSLNWKALQAPLHMLILAFVCMFAGCKHSVWTFTEPVTTSSATYVLEHEDVYWIPVLGSGSLLGLFLVLKYLSVDWVKQLLQLCMVASCAIGAAGNVEEFCKLLSPSAEKTKKQIAEGSSPEISASTRTQLTPIQINILKCLVGFGLALAYAMTKHWIVNNIMGLSFCLLGIRHISLPNFRAGVVLLSGLFVYDVFWVFFSKPIFGSNVMVSVAKGIEAPIKLLLPRDFGGCGEFKFAMLGLGDIAVPGLFCALLAKWDAVKMGEGSSKGFTYLNVILLMYILSLATTIVVMVVFNHAQPALLYICPYLLLGSAAVALARGEFSELFAFSLPQEQDSSAKRSE